MNMAWRLLAATFLLSATAPTTAAPCSPADTQDCRMVPCGATFCVQCRKKGGGGNLKCDPVQASALPVAPLGGNLMEVPDIARMDFCKIVEMAGSGATFDRSSLEAFRQSLEREN